MNKNNTCKNDTVDNDDNDAKALTCICMYVYVYVCTNAYMYPPISLLRNAP